MTATSSRLAVATRVRLETDEESFRFGEHARPPDLIGTPPRETLLTPLRIGSRSAGAPTAAPEAGAIPRAPSPTFNHTLASLALGLILSIAPANAATVTVFAAASLTESLREIGVNHEKQSGDKVVFNFGASSLLARQIEEGAPADIFFSADEAKMDELEKSGDIVKETRKSRLANSLVVVVEASHPAAIHSLQDLTNVAIRRIALADPKGVPAGLYAKAHLEKLKLWSRLEPKVVPTENVRAALAAVESGNVEAGIVYKTDAAISKKVVVAHEVPRAEGPNISYPMALVKASKQPEAAMRFLSYLDSVEADRVFGKFGFVIRK